MRFARGVTFQREVCACYCCGLLDAISERVPMDGPTRVQLVQARCATIWPKFNDLDSTQSVVLLTRVISGATKIIGSPETRAIDRIKSAKRAIACVRRQRHCNKNTHKSITKLCIPTACCVEACNSDELTTSPLHCNCIILIWDLTSKRRKPQFASRQRDGTEKWPSERD